MECKLLFEQLKQQQNFKLKTKTSSLCIHYSTYIIDKWIFSCLYTMQNKTIFNDFNFDIHFNSLKFVLMSH